MSDRRGSTILNLDIWAEIIRYYRIHPGDTEWKTETLQSLALVSRRLTPLAQSEMWRTIHDIHHVVGYINYLEESNFVSGIYHQVLRRPMQNKNRERIREILSYTRNFVLDDSSSSDIEDFQFIHMSIGEPHLFKNLKTIDINWRCIEENVLSLFLVSPHIESVTHRSVEAQMDQSTVLFFHSALRTLNAPIKSISLHHPSTLSPGIIPRLLHSGPNVALNVECEHFIDEDCFTAWLLAFSACSNLTSLVFRSRDVDPFFWDDSAGTKNEKFHLVKLRELELEGHSQCDFLLQRLECPSLTNLTLMLRAKIVVGELHIFSSAAKFVQLENLSITFKNPQFLTLDHIQPLLDSPSTLRQLKITGVASRLTEANIVSILNVKPTLQTLAVYGPKSHVLPPSILFTVARHRLQAVCLPIRLSGVMSLDDIQVSTNRHPLTEFCIPEGSILPESTKEKLKFAEFIYHMFPSAKIRNLGSDFGELVEDLEVMRAHISQILERRV